jgi:hypothetical protein
MHLYMSVISLVESIIEPARRPLQMLMSKTTPEMNAVGYSCMPSSYQ